MYDAAAVYDNEPTYTEISGGHDVIENTYAVAYANTGPSDVPMCDPLILPTLPISLDDFKHHVTNCHLNDDNEFSDQYQVIKGPQTRKQKPDTCNYIHVSYKLLWLYNHIHKLLQ